MHHSKLLTTVILAIQFSAVQVVAQTCESYCTNYDQTLVNCRSLYSAGVVGTGPISADAVGCMCVGTETVTGYYVLSECYQCYLLTGGDSDVLFAYGLSRALQIISLGRRLPSNAGIRTSSTATPENHAPRALHIHRHLEQRLPPAALRSWYRVLLSALVVLQQHPLLLGFSFQRQQLLAHLLPQRVPQLPPRRKIHQQIAFMLHG
ncbi:uncharacterized protein K444DRAFT_614958 [Hyaloscypha bicolor E]|uniref:Uncharacterized protein n=1 Tax=Hyaloscypha bicolor E TaxID=1095630 RepID=A0A2J6T3I2_9HELO|nr:uncharacterized protein K444DRAFT_614958 [Hyaloscypha bicolor E]PMD57559.1 hypothetical protein K444DRAFT_614958 [Hyaloscypha bicolor E]